MLLNQEIPRSEQTACDRDQCTNQLRVTRQMEEERSEAEAISKSNEEGIMGFSLLEDMRSGPERMGLCASTGTRMKLE